MTRPGNTAGQEQPVELEGVPQEESIEATDAAERTDLDPEEQPNYTDPERPDLT